MNATVSSKDRAAIRAPARELAPVQLTVHGCEGLTGPGTMTGIEIDDVAADQIDTVGDLMRVIESFEANRSDATTIGGMTQR